jgi:hypothetical protein
MYFDILTKMPRPEILRIINIKSISKEKVLGEIIISPMNYHAMTISPINYKLYITTPSNYHFVTKTPILLVKAVKLDGQPHCL